MVQVGGSNNTASTNCAPPQRKLTQQQRESLKTSLERFGSHPYSIRHTEGSLEAQIFADEIKDVFASAHWTEEPGMMLFQQREAVGLWILVPKDDPQPEGARDIYQAITNAGLTVKGVEVPGMKAPNYVLMVGLDDVKQP